MSIQAQNTELNIVPGGIIPVVHVSQYDVDRVLTFKLYDRNSEASLASGTTAVIEGTKPDGNGFQYAATISGNTVTVNTTIQMTILSGTVDCKIVLRNGTQVIGTALFIMDVEKAGINENTPISETDLPLIIAEATEQMERAEAAAEAAALSETNAATSETNAATSETNVANSEIICGSFMRMAGVSAASAEQSAIISGSFMRTAGNYADEAEASATSANVNALKSEGHAIGTQNGTPVSSDSPYYHNNAKYWADEARQSSAGGVAARVIATAEPTNISTHAYAIGDQFVYNGILYTATSAISVGDTIAPGTNCFISDTITEQIGNAGHTILNESGTELAQRSNLQFTGAIVSDDETNNATVVETVNPVEYEEDIYGVNLLNVKPQTVRNVTFSVDANGYITTDVPDTREWSYANCNAFANLKTGKYKVKAFQETAHTKWYAGFMIYKSDGTIVFSANQSDQWNSFIANGGEFTLSEDALIGVEYKIGNGSYAFAIYKDKLDIEDYRKFNEQSIQHQLTEQTNILGAKNLIQNTATSQVVNGVTFTVNDDGSVSTSGTANADISFVLSQGDGLPSEDTILSGCPSGGSNGGYKLNWAYHGSDYGGGVTIPYKADIGQIRIQVKSGTNMNGKTFYPMLRLASDPDNTYVPYAMTNRELTEKKINLSDLKTVVSSSSDFAAFKTAIANL